MPQTFETINNTGATTNVSRQRLHVSDTNSDSEGSFDTQNSADEDEDDLSDEQEAGKRKQQPDNSLKIQQFK